MVIDTMSKLEIPVMSKADGFIKLLCDTVLVNVTCSMSSLYYLWIECETDMLMRDPLMD